MARYDLLFFLVAYLFFVSFTPLYRKVLSEKPIVAVILLVCPVFFISMVVYRWGQLMLDVSCKIDSALMYVGVTAQATPYLSSVQVDSPTFFAFMRFALSLGDGSLALYQRILDVGNYISLAVIFGSLIPAIYVLLKKKAGHSALSIVSLFTVSVVGLLLAFRNMELANTNIWVAGFLALYLMSVYFSSGKLADFLGGMALGVAFMIKPYFLLVFIFLFFSSWESKRFGRLAGVIAAGVLGFFGSMMVSGIGLDTYRQFLFEVTDTLYHHETYYKNLFSYNLSLLKYLPIHLLGAVSMLCILIFSFIAYFAAKNSEGNEIPWFFITLLPFPIIWDAHLMGIFPAFLFFLLQKKDAEQVFISAAFVCVIFFSAVIKIPIVPNALLFALWAREIFPLSFTISSGRAAEAERHDHELSSHRHEAGQDAEATYDVLLKEIGPDEINVIKEIRAITGLGLRDAKAIVDSAPTALINVPKYEAEQIEARLSELGANVEIRQSP